MRVIYSRTTKIFTSQEVLGCPLLSLQGYCRSQSDLSAQYTDNINETQRCRWKFSKLLEYVCFPRHLSILENRVINESTRIEILIHFGFMTDLNTKLGPFFSWAFTTQNKLLAKIQICLFLYTCTWTKVSWLSTRQNIPLLKVSFQNDTVITVYLQIPSGICKKKKKKILSTLTILKWITYPIKECRNMVF